jgi:hypothetical protein
MVQTSGHVSKEKTGGEICLSVHLRGNIVKGIIWVKMVFVMQIPCQFGYTKERIAKKPRLRRLNQLDKMTNWWYEELKG